MFFRIFPLHICQHSKTYLLQCMVNYWSRKWQPTPVFLPGKFRGQRSLAGCSPRGRKELDTTEQLNWTCLLFKPPPFWELAFLLFVGNLCYCNSQVVPVVKKPPLNARDARDTGSIPGSERSPGVGNGNPLQYSCLENSVDRGARWATVHGVAKS